MSENITINWNKRILAYPKGWTDDQIYVAYMNYMDERENICKEMDDGPYKFWTEHEAKVNYDEPYNTTRYRVRVGTNRLGLNKIYEKDELWRFISKDG